MQRSASNKLIMTDKTIRKAEKLKFVNVHSTNSEFSNTEQSLEALAVNSQHRNYVNSIILLVEYTLLHSKVSTKALFALTA